MSKTMAISGLKTAVQREAEGNFDVYRPLEALNFITNSQLRKMGS